MTQTRLNHVGVCHVHRDIEMEISSPDIDEEFVRANDVLYGVVCLANFRHQQKFACSLNW